MGKLTTEQAKKIMEAVKNAETNPIDDKFYPKNKITTADKIDTGEPRPLPDKKTKKMPGKITGKVKTLLGDLPKDEAKILGNLPKGKPQYVTGVNNYNTGGDASCGCASCMGESAKGAGAAIRGTNFKGVF